jgi:hypothetical protein
MVMIANKKKEKGKQDYAPYKRSIYLGQAEGGLNAYASRQRTLNPPNSRRPTTLPLTSLWLSNYCATILVWLIREFSTHECCSYSIALSATRELIGIWFSFSFKKILKAKSCFYP